MTSYNDLVRAAIQQAQYKQKDIEKNTTILYKRDNGSNTVTRFYKKGSVIWCQMVTGCITTNARVYKVNTDKPYIRDCGKYWYLGDKEKACIRYLLEL